MGITTATTLNTEIVLQERKTSSEFIIIEIHENISQRTVRADVELGPFTTETRPNGEETKRGSGRRSVQVWNGAEYDAVRDTWTNADLVTAVAAKLSA